MVTRDQEPRSGGAGHSVRRWAPYAVVGALAFALGSATGRERTAEAAAVPGEQDVATRVTGIGGIFFKSEDPTRTLEWYREHLGIASADWGGFAFQWRENEQADEIGYTVWGAFPKTTDYFSPSVESFMINFRVEDLPGLLAALRQEGVEVVGEMQEHPNGKFAWILDPEGRKVELWEPVPSGEDPYLQ